MSESVCEGSNKRARERVSQCGRDGARERGRGRCRSNLHIDKYQAPSVLVSYRVNVSRD